MFDVKLVWEAKKEMNFPFYSDDKISFIEEKKDEAIKDNLIKKEDKALVSKDIEIKTVKKLRDTSADLFLDTSKNISYASNMLVFLISKNISIRNYDPNVCYLDTDVILLCREDDNVKNAKTFIMSEDLSRKKELFTFLKENFKERLL